MSIEDEHPIIGRYGEITPAVEKDELLGSSEQIKPSNPWETVAVVPMTSQVEKPISDEKRAEADQYAREREQNERKETLTQAGVTITLDKEKIRSVLERMPEEILGKPSSFMPEQESKKEIEARRSDLQNTLEHIARLPENLTFEPGITIILGENGAGKSTLAKAIYYAVKYADIAYRDPEWAYKYVYEPRDDDLTEYVQAGLAPEIAKAISVSQLDHSAPGFRYYDSSVIMGRRFQLDRSAGRAEHRYDEHGFTSRTRATHSYDGRSHRQTVDDELFGFIRQEKSWDERDDKKGGRRHHSSWAGPQIMFVDEPETGMSPKRHRQVAEELLETCPEKSAIIVPTNSIILADSDLPRIDLDYPERGIFRPSEYPEGEVTT